MRQGPAPQASGIQAKGIKTSSGSNEVLFDFYLFVSGDIEYIAPHFLAGYADGKSTTKMKVLAAQIGKTTRRY